MRSEVIQRERIESNLATPAIAEASRFCLRLMGGLIGLAFVWIALSSLVVPSVIKSAYRGESLPFLNSIISGQEAHPVGYYLASWQSYSWRVLGIIFVVGLIPLPLVATGPEVQRYFEARYGKSFVLKPEVVNTILAILGFALVFYLYYLYPVGYVYFVTEDYWAEHATFVSWAMTCYFLTWMLVKGRGSRKPVFVLLALGAFFLAMEEVSWGQRLVGLNPPAWFLKHNLQQEIGLHNLLLFGWKKYVAAGMAVVLWGILLPLMAKKWGRPQIWCNKLGIPIVPIHLWPLFFLASFFLIFPLFYRSHEAGELFLAIAILSLSLDLVLTMRRGTRAGVVSTIVALASMILTLGMLDAFLVRFYSWPGQLKNQLNFFAARSYPHAGMYCHAEMLFKYMTQHPEFLTKETRVQHGVLLMRMGEDTNARLVLELALADQERFQSEAPEDPEPYRNAGKVLTLLGRQKEAQMEFRAALEKDRAQLERSVNVEAQVLIRWSLTRTFIASGDYEAASQQLSWTRALASPSMRYLTDRWMNTNLSEDDLDRLRSFLK